MKELNKGYCFKGSIHELDEGFYSLLPKFLAIPKWGGMAYIFHNQIILGTYIRSLRPNVVGERKKINIVMCSLGQIIFLFWDIVGGRDG